MRGAANPRRALLVLSDGEDNFSRYSVTELRRFLREAGVTVYAIGLSGPGLSGWSARALRRITEETGGWYMPVEGIDKLGDAVAEMSRAIRAGYVIGIRPANRAGAGKYSRLQVRVDSPGLEPLRVSWRGGYIAAE